MRTAARIDTVKLLTALGRAMGANVEVRPRPGRPPRPTAIEQVLADMGDTATQRRRRRLKPNPKSFRRRLARASTEAEVREILHEIRHVPKAGKYSAAWDTATIRRYLPTRFKDLVD